MGVFGNGDKKDRKPKATASGSNKPSTFDSRFVRIELTTGEKEDFRGQLADGEFAGVTPDTFFDLGYAVSGKRESDNKTVLVTIRPIDQTGNEGLLLSGRGRDFTTALAVVAYKHFVLCAGGSWQEAENARGGSVDDIG